MAGRSWWGIVKRTYEEFQDDHLTDWAAALTYYGVLSLFPMLIALVSVLGLFGSAGSVTSLINSLNAVGLGGIARSITTPLNDVVQHRSSAGVLLVVGIVVALWSASGYIGAFMRAANAIYEVEEGRPFYKLRPLQLLVTLVMVVLLALVAIGLVITGPLTDAVGDLLGLGHTATTIFSIAKWPVMLVIVMAMFAGLYYIAPNVRQPKFRWVSPGGIVAVVIWIAASAAFGLYIAHFNDYSKNHIAPTETPKGWRSCSAPSSTRSSSASASSRRASPRATSSSCRRASPPIDSSSPFRVSQPRPERSRSGTGTGGRAILRSGGR